MVSIQAPGVEINEIDLSFYDFPPPREETTNVYVTGFASKGLNYVPYKFTSKSTALDLTDTFGTPENEAERYFYYACLEVIQRPKAVLYASRLPYANNAMSSIVGAEYVISSIGAISSDTRSYLGYIVENESSSTVHIFANIESEKAYKYVNVDNIANVTNTDSIAISTLFDNFDGLAKSIKNNVHSTDFTLNSTENFDGTPMSAWANVEYTFERLGTYEIANGDSTLSVTACAYKAKYGGSWGNIFGEVFKEDNTIKTAAKINFSKVKKYSKDDYEKYHTGETRPGLNKFIIFDKTEALYDEVPVDRFHKGTNQLLIGIVPVVTTAANALYYLKMLETDEDDYNQLANYEALGNLVTTAGDKDNTVSLDEVVGTIDSVGSIDRIENPYIYADLIPNSETGVNDPKVYNSLLVEATNSRFFAEDNKQMPTMSKTAASYFPWIGKNDSGDFDREYMKNIGIVVFKGYLDAEEGNKINFLPVEAFAGNLKPGTKNSVTGKSLFIDEIVNTNSQLIELHSNCFNSDDNNFYSWDEEAEEDEDKDPCKSLVFRAVNPMLTEDEHVVEGETHDIDTGDKKVVTRDNPEGSSSYVRPGLLNGVKWDDVDIFVVQRMDAPVFGFKKSDCIKIISVANSITKALDKCFDKMKDMNAKQIDIFVDAGVSNIAQFYASCKCPTGIFYTDKENAGWYSIIDTDSVDPTTVNKYKVALEYNPTSPTGVKEWQLNDYANTQRWQLILNKYDNFCKNMRRDCMFIADGLRPLCLKGNAKIVRPTSYTNTISNSIAPKMKYMAGAVDTSYGAGYCDWMLVEDTFSGLNFWIPPSIKAVGVYIDTTNNARYWDAPAGVNRAVLDVKDIAFSPTVEEAAALYTKSWNYCTYYEIEGNVLEGQRTFQTRATAFDRVNVRRLFLYLERIAFLKGRKFLYEGNTAYNRQRFVDAITPYLEDAKVNGGMYDYRIVCDETNNDDDTINRNELHIRIGIQPVKSVEFIDCTFVCLRHGGSWTEAGF